MEIKSTEKALELCREFDIQIPREVQEVAAPLPSRRRTHAKMSESGMQEQQRPFVAAASFHGPKAGYVFTL